MTEDTNTRIEALVAPVNTDPRYAIVVSQEPESPLSSQHLVGFYAIDAHGADVGLAVTLAGPYDDADVIARMVREAYEEAGTGLTRRPK